MSSLDQIRVVQGVENRELVHSILQEISTLLERYLQRGAQGELDLKGLPLTEIDREALYRALGQGEITMQLSVMGKSEIVETAYPGVWRILHSDQEGRRIADLIEVGAVPTIVSADRAEMLRSVDRLREETIKP